MEQRKRENDSKKQRENYLEDKKKEAERKDKQVNKKEGGRKIHA